MKFQVQQDFRKFVCHSARIFENSCKILRTPEFTAQGVLQFEQLNTGFSTNIFFGKVST